MMASLGGKVSKTARWCRASSITRPSPMASKMVKQIEMVAKILKESKMEPRFVSPKCLPVQ
jgi:hypothetical protein